MNRVLTLCIILTAGLSGATYLLIEGEALRYPDLEEKTPVSKSSSPTPSISEESALLAAREHVKDELPLHEYDSSVAIRDGDFYVTFRTKKPAMGGAVVVRVEGKNGQVVKSFWYQ